MSVEDIKLIEVVLRLIRHGDEWVIPTVLGVLTPAEKRELRSLIADERRCRGLQ